MLLDTLVNPQAPIPTEATAIHGLTDSHVAGAPVFGDLVEQLAALLHGKRVVVYNASFDRSMLWGEVERLHGQDQAAWRVADAWVGVVHWSCAMEQYAAYVGHYSDYTGSYRYLPLSGGDHSAIGDCRATLALLRGMAEDA